MTRRRILGLLLLASITGCGSGRAVPSGSPQPDYAPPSDNPTAGQPAPAAEPAPQVTPEPAQAPTPAAPAAPAAPAPTTPGSSAGYAPYGGQPVQIRRIGEYSTSGITAPARLVIRDDSSYARFWASLGAGERPAVDFSRDIVIAVAAGQQTTGGHGITVERVTRTGDGLAVEVVETAPGAGCMTAQALTQPVDVIVVEGAGARTWSFSDQTRTQPCQ